MKASRFYQNRICLNVLTKDVDNALDVNQATEGHVLVGVLSSRYDTVEAAAVDMKKYAEATDGALSIGLGAGDPNQWKMVAEISRVLEAEHVNQVFSAVGYTKACARNEDVWINGLVRPTETAGLVNIATGPESSKGKAVYVPVAEAITLIREMGGNALKFFPMDGLTTIEQYQSVAEACAAAAFPLEPTGGIDLNNFETIVRLALEAGVPRVIPHVYSSIIDTATGETRIEDVETLYTIMKKVGDAYAN